MSANSSSLRGIAFGACAVLIVSWLVPAGRMPEAASVQVPDAGRQRQEMIEELRNVNKRLAEINQQIKEIREDAAKAEKSDTAAPKRAKP